MTNLFKVIVITLVLLIPFEILFGQEISKSKGIQNFKIFTVSIYSGASFSTFTGDASNFVDSLNLYTGYSFDPTYRRFINPVGLSFNIKPIRWLSFKTGFLYSPKGMKMEDEISDGNNSINVEMILKVQYLEVPIMLELSPISKSNIEGTRIYINGGVIYDFLINSQIVSKAWIGTYGNSSNTERETKDWNSVNQIDFGYILGIGISSDDFYLGVEYEKGTKSVSSTGWNFKNKVISVILGFYFN